MKLPWLLALVFLLACATENRPRVSASVPSDPPIAQSVTPEAASPDLAFTFRQDADRFSVLVRFRGDASGRTVLDLPSEWGGQTELWREVEKLRVTSKGATLVAGAAIDHPVVTHPAGAVVELAYEFSSKPETMALDDAKPYRPLVHAKWFHFIGHSLFVTPAWAEADERSIHLRWEGLDPKVHLAHSFGVDLRDQSFHTSLAKLRHSVFVGGDFRVTVAEVKGKPLAVALRGAWGFTDTELVDLVKQVVHTERSFFDDHAFDRFLITLIPIGTGCCSYGGTGLTDSFAAFIASNLGIEGRMKHLLAHELFHTWNGRRIQRQEPEELVYWFSEGFTDYYSDVLLLRAGLITFEEAVASYNRVLRTYSLSPVRNVPNDSIRKSFWKDRGVERLPYQRGNILAHEWNAKIRSASPGASLDDVMRDLLRDAMANGAVVSAEKVNALITAYLPGGVGQDIRRFVDEGETIAVSSGAMGPCAHLVTEPMGPFDLGYDETAANDEGTLRQVRKDGPAYRAGAREGMSLKHSKYSSDPTKPVQLTVVDGKKTRTISYLPQGSKQPVPQYRVDAQKVAELGAKCWE